MKLWVLRTQELQRPWESGTSEVIDVPERTVKTQQVHHPRIQSLLSYTKPSAPSVHVLHEQGQLRTSPYKIKHDTIRHPMKGVFDFSHFFMTNINNFRKETVSSGAYFNNASLTLSVFVLSGHSMSSSPVDRRYSTAFMESCKRNSLE